MSRTTTPTRKKTTRTTTNSAPATTASSGGGAAGTLWTALLATPDQSATTLADHAGIGRSTAGKLLARWEAQGHAVRIGGPITGGRKVADRWQPAPEHTTATADPDATTQQPRRSTRKLRAVPDPAPQDATTPPKDPAPTAGAEIGAVPDKRARLAKGALRGMVEDYLREHPGEHGPAAIGKHLQRSGGAVANALEKLVAEGYAQRVTESPKRYALGTDTD